MAMSSISNDESRRKSWQTLDMDYEIIYVNDGSKDRTDELIHQLAAGDRMCGR